MSKLIKVNQKSIYLAEVVLNRPDKLNAMTKPMWIELGKVFKRLSRANIHRFICGWLS